MARRKTPTNLKKQASETDRSSQKTRYVIQIGATLFLAAVLVYVLVMEVGRSDRSTSATAGNSEGQGEQQQADSEAMPTAPITINPPAINFGEVAPNTLHTQRVTLTNTSSSTVRIIDTRPTCPCTKVNRQASSISPGQSITLDIEMDSESRLGPKSVGVNVMFVGYEPMHIRVNASVVDGSA